MDEFIATIKAFGFGFAPTGWALCMGQTLSIASNNALFALIGTTYGGDGQTTFKLPDLRGRTAIGQGQGPGLQNHPLGQIGGSESVALNSNNLPSHTHTATSILYAEGLPGDKPGPNGRLLAAGSASVTIYKDVDPGTQNLAMSSESVATTVNPSGGSQPFNISNPFLAVNYSICLQGIYPPRD